MKETTILYSIIYADKKAYDIIPELKNAWNIDPYIVPSVGGIAEISIINPNNYLILASTNRNFISTNILENKIQFTFSGNISKLKRDARVYLSIKDNEEVSRLLEFIVYQY